jgi:hypothetical protein
MVRSLQCADMGLQFEGFSINIDGRQQWKGRRQEGAPTINIEGSARLGLQSQKIDGASIYRCSYFPCVPQLPNGVRCSHRVPELDALSMCIPTSVFSDTTMC